MEGKNVMLLKAQAHFDEVEFDNGGYVELANSDAKIRHIHLHVAKAAFKMVKEHSVDKRSVYVSEVIPDVTIYRTQLVNIAGGQEAEQFVIDSARPDMMQDYSFAEQEAVSKDRLISASGHLATYLESIEHGKPADRQAVLVAAIDLHVSAAGLARVLDMDMDTLHLERMERILRTQLPAAMINS